jgi:hypothetical protein
VAGSSTSASAVVVHTNDLGSWFQCSAGGDGESITDPTSAG